MFRNASPAGRDNGTPGSIFNGGRRGKGGEATELAADFLRSPSQAALSHLGLRERFNRVGG